MTLTPDDLTELERHPELLKAADMRRSQRDWEQLATVACLAMASQLPMLVDALAPSIKPWRSGVG